MNYATYEFYTDIYRGEMPLDSWEKSSVIASREIDLKTHFKHQNTENETINNQLAMCCCGLAECIDSYKDINRAVTSFSNDGYSESYTSSEDIKKAMNQCKNQCFKYLYMPINLIGGLNWI